MNPEFKDLADAIYRDRVRRARSMTPGERIVEGMQLFDGVLKRMEGGVRSQFPQATESEVRDILDKRLLRLRQVADYRLIERVKVSP